MSQEPLERDAALADALRTAAADATAAAVDWEALRHRINTAARPELARRRKRYQRVRLMMPLALAASIALVAFAWPRPESSFGPEPARQQAVTTSDVSVEELLDADVSDVQFRALLFGATEADDLLLIAAGEDAEVR